MLTGEYGSGKTVISRLIFEILPRDIFDFAFITNPQLNPEEMLKEICRKFKLETPQNPAKTDLLDALNGRFLANLKEGKHTIIIVDEAQTIMDPLTLEELRLLLNYQHNSRFLITLLLFGQSELREKIQNFPQLNQRIALNYKLDSLGKADTEKYIDYRLNVARSSISIFDQNALDIIWEHSGGIPRIINTIADWCLLLGYSRLKDTVDEHIATKAVTDLGYPPPKE